MNKFHDIGLQFENYHPDMMAFSETWLNPDVLDTEVAIDGYNVYKTGRWGGVRAREVVLYIKASITAISVFSMDNVENLVV